MDTYTYEKSAQWFERAIKVIPQGVYGHLGPAEGCFIPITSYPLFSQRAKGSYFWDVDGNRFVDYMCAYGPNVLGYGDEDVDAAAKAQLERGNCTTSPSYVMVEFAELLTDTIASADWAFFAKNGGDVTSLAVMTARYHTGRKKIVFINGYYHGVAPWTQKADSPGTIEEDCMNAVYIPFNDPAAFERAIAENPDEIACLIATPYYHGNFYENVLPEDGYWKKMREICDRNGIVLIFDDVRTGFRLDLQGTDHYYGIKADMSCYCKALANGYNVSALVGGEHIKGSVSSIMYTGSYWMSAEPFAAGIACINKLKALDAPNLFRRLGNRLTDGLKKAAAENGFKLSVSGEPALFYLLGQNDDNLYLHQEWVAECVRRGLFITNHHNHFINASLTEEDINFTCEVADDAFKAVRKNHPELDWG
ncbi:MAG: aminotransferase class III-fold pyridoxal phosphate-dependent enzyme [Clostridiales bacterium]|nr:aminotransferase class III-fold pyridoxal phosphate-dependent enzyme [Clostridiales bacterium]